VLHGGGECGGAAGGPRTVQSSLGHLRGLTLPGQLVGLSPIACAKQTIGLSLAAEQMGAQFFGTGATLSGLVEVPAGTRLDDDASERLRLQFTKKHGGISKSHAVGVLTGGATFRPLSVSPEEAQFLETRRYGAAEIANLYGVPVEFVGDGVKGAAGYVTGVSMRFRMWYLSGLMPRMVRIETALSSLLPRPAYVKFNRNALLQMDPSERIAFYQAAQMGEWMTRNEIRALEEMNPLPDGDEPLHSVQWQENQPEPAPAGFDVKEPA
jgi:HK97 family phage portal protein